MVMFVMVPEMQNLSGLGWLTSSQIFYLFPSKKAIIEELGLAEATGIRGLSGAFYLVYLVQNARTEEWREGNV